MTVIIKIGRRLPRSFYKRQVHKLQGLLSFQENMWQMIKGAFRLAKRKAEQSPEEQVTISIDWKTEPEGLHYNIEWILVTITSPVHEKEVDEYDDCMKMYDKFSAMKQIFNKTAENNEEFKKAFKSKIISEEDFEKAKKAGFGALNHKNIANTLLEHGIVTVIEKSW